MPGECGHKGTRGARERQSSGSTLVSTWSTRISFGTRSNNRRSDRCRHSRRRERSSRCWHSRHDSGGVCLETTDNCSDNNSACGVNNIDDYQQHHCCTSTAEASDNDPQQHCTDAAEPRGAPQSESYTRSTTCTLQGPHLLILVYCL